MKFIADVHLHSHYSRATSKNLNLEYLSKFAQLKGVQVVGSGDIAHPGWLAEMKTKLAPAEEGLFCLKEEYENDIRPEVFKTCQGSVRFMLAGEVSNIYKKRDKVRKIHHVVFFPSFDAVEKFQARLEKIGNIRSDGRPILGLDSRDLLEIILETDPQGYLIPAHIWTPWFALLGSMSGFDSVEECFDDLTSHIFALETGLSSDPPMNWRLSVLDRYTLVSNSDAHSPQKLGREANIFNTELSYPAIFQALKNSDPVAFGGTIEFFPEEGKYHYDGHRKCSVRWHPAETIRNNNVCVVCGKPVTVGVMHRVEKLADRPNDFRPNNRHPYKSLISLPEILAEMYNTGVATKRVIETYETLLSKLGPELDILINLPLEEIARNGGALLAEGIRRMRSGEIEIAAGYDGEYGTIRLFSENEREQFSTQLGFFDPNKIELEPSANLSEQAGELKINDQIASYSPPQTAAADEDRPHKASPKDEAPKTDDHPLLKDLNARQRQAVLSNSPALMIVAGPGAGKTATLTRRIAYLIEQNRAVPENILAITFTNKAAEEMRQRLRAWAGPRVTEQIAVKTFHALGALILKEEGSRLGYRAGFTILGESERARFFKTINEKESVRVLSLISHAKNLLLAPPASSSHEDFKEVPQFAELYAAYQFELIKNHCVDFDDLIFLPAQMFEQFPEVAAKYQQRFQWLFVDEYQDVNFAQYRLLRQLAASQNRLCVIGDPDQAIYGFRGARREFFLRFREDFPAAEIVHLDKSYRSPQFILEAAAQMIAAGTEAQTKGLVSDILREGKVQIYRAPTDKAEAEYVVHEIEKMVGGTSYFSLDSGRVVEHEPAVSVKSFADFAVLYRLHSQSRLLEEAFSRSGIPFQIIGETPFYAREEIKSAITLLKFFHNPQSDLHLEELLFDKNLGIGETTAQQIIESAREKQVSLWSALTNASLQKNAAAKFVEKIKAGRERLPGKTVAKIIETVVANFFDKENMNEKKREGFERLILQARPFGDRVDEFLQMAALSAANDEYDPRSDRVALMTLHAAKGLEFPVVFIVGCEENLFPYLKTAAPAELEEERRLLYVGMTRAKEKLILVHAGSRFLFGEKMQNAPSRFLNDIENRLKEFAETRLAPKTALAAPEPNPQLSLF